MRFYQTTDPWAAIAIAAEHDQQRGIEHSRASVKNYNGVYYVARVFDVDFLGVQHVDYETMALDFPEPEL